MYSFFPARLLALLLVFVFLVSSTSIDLHDCNSECALRREGRANGRKLRGRRRSPPTPVSAPPIFYKLVPPPPAHPSTPRPSPLPTSPPPPIAPPAGCSRDPPPPSQLSRPAPSPHSSDAQSPPPPPAPAA